MVQGVVGYFEKRHRHTCRVIMDGYADCSRSVFLSVPLWVYDFQFRNTQIISHPGMVLQYSTHGRHHLQCGRPARLQAHLPRLYTLVKASFLLVKSPLMVNRCLSANQFNYICNIICYYEVVRLIQYNLISSKCYSIING